MGWSVKFVPDEVDSMIVVVDGEHVLSWTQAEGQVMKDLPPKHFNKSKIHLRAEGTPNGRNATLKIYWNGAKKHEMHFDNGEDADLKRR